MSLKDLLDVGDMVMERVRAGTSGGIFMSAAAGCDGCAMLSAYEEVGVVVMFLGDGFARTKAMKI